MTTNVNYFKKRVGGIVMAAAMAVALVVPAGVQATTYIGNTDWMIAAPDESTEKNLRCYNGSVSYNMGLVTVLANGTTGYTKINQKLNGTCTLYIGYSTISRSAGTYTTVGSHKVLCECKNRAAYGKADGKYEK